MSLISVNEYFDLPFFSLPKVNMADMLKNPIDLSEVQDFSMSKKQGAASSFAGKGKLDDMLTKLMKKNNCVSETATLLLYSIIVLFNIFVFV